ncbi:MAG: hypothetical protein PHE15_06840 [Dehalococcoidales bacterium]|nr:hypothetical protein [Dehalococcoidales bacterium]
MAGAIEYQKVMTEIVFINLPGPEEPTERMSGSELLHGFLADLYKSENPTIKQYISEICLKWNVHYKAASKK